MTNKTKGWFSGNRESLQWVRIWIHSRPAGSKPFFWYSRDQKRLQRRNRISMGARMRDWTYWEGF